MLTRAQRARIRTLARVCAARGDYTALIAYVEAIMAAPDAGVRQLLAGPPERKARLYLGTWRWLKAIGLGRA